MKQPNYKARDVIEHAICGAWTALRVVVAVGLLLAAMAAIASLPVALLCSPDMAAALFLWAALVAAASAAMAVLLDLFA